MFLGILRPNQTIKSRNRNIFSRLFQKNKSKNPTNVVYLIVLVIALVITHRSTFALPIQRTLPYYHTQDSH
jgi:hypothetical protein